MKYVQVFAGLRRSLSKREIPEQYNKDMKLLNPNSGVTSLVYEKNDKEVRIFTRDEKKKEYLTQVWGLNIGKLVDVIDTPNSRFESDIYVIDMPKLFPLSPDNRKIANAIVKAIQAGIKSNAAYYRNIDVYNINTLQSAINWSKKKYRETKDTIYKKAYKHLSEFYDFGGGYSDYLLDFSIRNFKQTSRGRLILLDPVADKRLIDILYGRR